MEQIFKFELEAQWSPEKEYPTKRSQEGDQDTGPCRYDFWAEIQIDSEIRVSE